MIMMEPPLHTRSRPALLHRCAAVEPGTHICLLYHSDEERNRLIAGYLHGAFERDEQPLYISDTRPLQSTESWLAEFGIFLPDEALIDSRTGYYPDGFFDSDDMLAPGRSRAPLSPQRVSRSVRNR